MKKRDAGKTIQEKVNVLWDVASKQFQFSMKEAA